ncbi:MAG: methyltransferase domain-containing protein [Lewinellaceae bacterium]|nr:methyltransferase domain-containing protein [Lewinellaceae bacterium]
MPTLTPQFWNTRWQNRQTGWDLGQASPPLTAYIDQLPESARDWRILIPGCGNAYEAEYLLQKGFQNITLVDIAPVAVEQIRLRLDREAPGWGNHLQLICGDFFDLEGTFDLVLEQTFFCALEPHLRSAYCSKMYQVLVPGGRLAGVLFDRDFEGGPPFGGHTSEYLPLFSSHFTLRTLAPCYNSAAPRAGSEVFLLAQKDEKIVRLRNNLEFCTAF